MSPTQKLDLEFVRNSNGYKFWSYGCMGLLVLFFLVQLLILCVFWKFYKTGKEAAKLEVTAKADENSKVI